MSNIAIFASGSGSNAENIYHSFQGSSNIVSAVFCNNPKAYVIERCAKLGVPCEVFNKQVFSSEDLLVALKKYEIDFIVLAGFLWKIPQLLLDNYPDRIINIHPALLPKYGGKGMYGSFVHEAVVANKETESGITIHLVNENYDEGRTLFQAKCSIAPNDSAEDVAAKIHELEYKHFPEVVADYIGSFGGQ